MIIKSLNLNLRDSNTRKILMIIIIALLVAGSLIFITSVNMIKESNIIKDNSNFFELSSYHLKANIKVISNKNNNSYELEEFYLKDENGKENFKFVTKNSDETSITYIIKDSSIYVKNEKEKSEYILSNYVINKNNLLSVSTFIELYNTILNNYENNSCVKSETIKTDNLTRYKISFYMENDSKHECDICNKYSDILKSGMDITRLELIYDTKQMLPLEYIVYSKEEAIIDINFLEFSINNKIDEKIFAF